MSLASDGMCLPQANMQVASTLHDIPAVKASALADRTLASGDNEAVLDEMDLDQLFENATDEFLMTGNLGQTDSGSLLHTGLSQLFPSSPFSQRPSFIESPKHSQDFRIEENGVLYAMSEKEFRRMRRRETNRESAQRMRKKRQEEFLHVNARLDHMQTENIRLKQLQLHMVETLQRMKRELAQWQVRAQGAQRQNNILLQQVLEKQLTQQPVDAAASITLSNYPGQDSAYSMDPSCATFAQPCTADNMGPSANALSSFGDSFHGSDYTMAAPQTQPGSAYNTDGSNYGSLGFHDVMHGE
ncbi:hypothetical protein WJX73_010029 [Symbiochloris irregularis]|uniref:BZIP domain-containing protein n=1 Tax=Symbiochloris irregularis TaxID=706552 RepID=A0AAW1NF14_9CHLO